MIFLLVLVSCCLGTRSGGWTVSPVEGEFIVSWNRYFENAERVSLLERLLDKFPSNVWEEVPRGYELPSDFSLLRVLNKSSEESVVDSLKARREVVRSVTPQLSVQGEEALKGASNAMSPASAGPNLPVASRLFAPWLWTKGITGARVKVAVFDTGLGQRGTPFLNNVMEQRDWTSDKSIEDGVGHGTFVASMVAGTNPQCMGLAPDTEMFFFRVFTSRRVSFTAWFLDAFNYAIHSKMDVLNLSIGGPDFMDRPFTEKVLEVTSSGIVMVSAIGNDGPVFGTLNNPADMGSVIGVGGLGRQENSLAVFSSRGMTTWELPGGYGRVKPDVVTLSTQLIGADRSSGCMEQSGTSMASPVIAGAVSLIVSSVPFEKRSELVNPASVKQVLIESAVRLVRGGVGLFEQGAGKLNLPGAVALMQSYQPRMSFHPPYLDTSECPYFSPYCEQPLFYSSMPLIFNATLLNGISVTGKLASAPSWEATSVGGQHLRIQFDWSQFVWPWTGHVGMRIVVAESGKSFQGLAEGVVTVAVKTPLRTEPVLVKLPIRVRVIPTPARRRRLLWDQYHNSRYPPGYFPRDDLQFMASPFDWNADHIHTNFLPLFRALRKQGYFVEVLGEPWTCFDARNYAALLVVDPEEELWEEEQRKLEIDMRTLGLSLLVLADWYNVDVMKKLRFQDQNTQQQWTPVTGGAHLPALNEFLEVFGVAFSTRVVRGLVTINGRTFDYASGATIGAFPKDAHLLSVEGLIDQRLQMVEEQSSAETEPHAIGGWFQLAQPSGGRVAVFGDSSFVDSSGRAPSREDKSAHRGYWMLEDVMAFLAGDLKAEQVLPTAAHVLSQPLSLMTEAITPRRFHLASLLRVSRVLHAKQSGVSPVCAVAEGFVGSSGLIGSYDWEAASAQRAAASKEEKQAMMADPVIVAHILGRKKPGRLSMVSSIIPLPWLVLFVGVLSVPVLLWYYERILARDRHSN